MTEKRKSALYELMSERDKIEDCLTNIENILKENFIEQFDLAYQHWIPQIHTALKRTDNWLSRGQFCMDDTISHIKDATFLDKSNSIRKFI